MSPLLSLCAWLASAAHADPGPVLTCGETYWDSCFNCADDREDNTCGAYSSACANPPSGAADRVITFRSETAAWVELDVYGDEDNRIGVYVNEGSPCGHTQACTPRHDWNAAWTVPFRTPANGNTYIAIEEVESDSWGWDYSIAIEDIVCCYDADGDGAYANAGQCAHLPASLTDCNDADRNNTPGRPEVCDGFDNDCDGDPDDGLPTARYYRDVDGDGRGNPLDPIDDCEHPGGYVTNNDDCDDTDERIYLGAVEVCDGIDNNCVNGTDEDVKNTYWRDADLDGHGDPANAVQACAAPDGYVANDGDCDDSTADRKPGLAEWCDGKDNDCNDVVDDGVGSTWYRDTDRDGQGDPDASLQACTNPGTWVDNSDDCDDGDAQRSPLLAESCDGKDNDCDDVVDDGVGATWYDDHDGDGFGDGGDSVQACSNPGGHVLNASDCDDGDADRKPSLSEWCDGKDNDCNLQVDDGVGSTWYADADGDGHGDSGRPHQACEMPEGFVADADDCDDGHRDRFPGADEVPDGLDNDCDLAVDEHTERSDDDRDGFTELAGDCNDDARDVSPAAVETCNQLDDDCDGLVDEDTTCVDDDGDGLSEIDGDCNDADPRVGPHRTEVPGDGIDNDCDGIVDAGSDDRDGDGIAPTGGDCDDGDPTAFPGAPELADGIDNDCDDTVDEGTSAFDDDGDGTSEDDGDCDDRDADVGPHAAETDNGRDDDCNGIVDDRGPAFDDDGDGLSDEQGDCDDGDATIRPGAAEVNNGRDDDCDGHVDEGFGDADGDGFTVDQGDCDDDDGWAHPDAAELCDGVDNDCDDLVDETCGGEDVAPPPPETASSCGSGNRAGLFGLTPLLVLFRRRR